MKRKYLLVSAALIAGMTAFSQRSYTFKQVLDAARTNNPFLKADSLSIPISQSDVVTAGLRYNPILNNQTLQLVNSKYFAENTKFYRPENRQVWWQLTKPFPLNNQRGYKIDMAEKAVVVAQKQHSDAERSTLLDAGSKWLDVWLSKADLELILGAKNNIDTLVQTNEIRLKNQVISSSEFVRTQLLADQYQLQLNAARQNYKNELQNLKQATGIIDSMTVDDNDPVITLSVIENVDSLIRLSYQQRADMQAAQGTIEVAKSNIQLQKSLSKPVPELGFIWNPQNTVPYFGFLGTIELPFFSRNQGEIKKSKIQLQQSEQSLYALRQQVRTEVHTVYETYQLNRETMNRYKQILQRAEQVLQSVKYAYTRGGTTLVDFLDAQRTWFDTKKGYHEADYNYRKSFLQLLYVTGLINQL